MGLETYDVQRSREHHFLTILIISLVLVSNKQRDLPPVTHQPPYIESKRKLSKEYKSVSHQE